MYTKFVEMREPLSDSIEVLDAFVYVKRDAVADDYGVGVFVRKEVTLALPHCKQP